MNMFLDKISPVYDVFEKIYNYNYFATWLCTESMHKKYKGVTNGQL